MISAIKRHPVFFAAAISGAAISIIAIIISVLLPAEAVVISNVFQWKRSSTIGLGAAVLSVVVLNYFLSLHLFYRDRASAYLLNLASALLALFYLMKVASLFYF